ncbi:ABC transporter substrate-binding protein [Aquibaculum arenosum]|uniref:ABC transporter substrate-binding protein n=1 Tax=Aquibaculum arenosum TaxID=3032591 RepID=A0ABT5YQT4_9PROT|nr:ABC transporter substrate-binding protein [Fodinicurvata sp. CAU 1616]MDF2097336.1 ABC transporter substrate-binding protein [Fodinicurvata sp. CAU 1616]
MRSGLLSAVSLIFGLAALSPTAATASEPQAGGTLTYAVLGEPSTYDCHAAVSFQELHYLAPHYSLLLRFNSENYPELEGDLAENWEVSDDGLVYTFHIRKGVTFHDGTPLTAADIKSTYDRIRNPPEGVVSVRQALYDDIETIETPDNHTVVMTLSQPNAGMLSNFASPWNCVYAAAKLEDDQRFPVENILGTGPFRFVEHASGAHWEGSRFDEYYHPDMPYLDGFRGIVMTNSALVNALSGNQVQAEFRGLAPADAERVKEARGDEVEFIEGGWLAFFFITFNTEEPPFDDVRVRQALTMAIDRWGGIEPMSRITFLQHVGGLTRPGSAMSLSDEELESLPGFARDMEAAREEAKRLLQEAGIENLSFTLTNRSTPPFVPLGLFLIDQWRQIGVSVEHRQLDTAQWATSRLSGAFEVLIDSAGEWNDDPSVQLNRFLSHDKFPANTSRAIDRKVDELYEKQKREVDPERRAELVNELESHLLTEAYSSPGFWGGRNVALASEVKGWNALPSHMVNQDLRSVWLDK